MTFARTVRLLVLLAIVAGFAASGRSLFAQSPGNVRQYDPAFDGAPAAPDNGDWGDIPAYVSAISGDARLERDDDATSDFEQVPLQIGDQIRTTRGRVEVLYSDGSVIALDEYSAITVDTESTWRLHTGRVKVVSRTGTFTVDAAPVGLARLRSSGDYRVTLSVNRRNEPEVELAVSRGSGELENPLGRTAVRAGTRALTTERYAPSIPYAFATPRDEFERWTESLEADRYGVTSAQYLPTELRAYGGDFDRYGYWSRHNSYGWVWYPRVSVGWEPFHSGRWSFVVGFGYNWIGGSRWEWPTHHYGRWDRYGSNWFWVPSRPSQWHRIGYSAPRRSYSSPIVYYTRPQSPRSFRGNTNSRPSVDDRRPSQGSFDSRSSAQPRVATPRSPEREQPQVTRPSTSQANRPSGFPATRSSQPNRSSDDGAFRTRQAPVNPPSETPRMGRPTREAPQQERPEPPRSQGSMRERFPTAQQPSPSRPAPSTEGSSRPSRGESRAPSTGAGMPDPQRPSAGPPPSGSRTPSSRSSSGSGSSSGSRGSSGGAVRRGGGGR